ncbi:MAG: hypothetical protein IPM60_15135 [Rhodospirillales bacterium]|nr:hypothetical protein [Rhodospirillales bacterium]
MTERGHFPLICGLDLPALRALADRIAVEIGRRERKTCPDCGAPIAAKSARCRRCHMRAKSADPAFRERQAEAVRAHLAERWQDPAFRERQAEAVRAHLAERWQDPAFRKRQAEAVRAVWQDPAFRKRQAEAVRAVWQDPAFRKRQAEAVRAVWQDPAFRKRQAEAVRAVWQDPAFRKRQAEAVRAHYIRREQALMIDLDDDAVLVFAAARDDGVPCAEAREVALMDMAERGKRREAVRAHYIRREQALMIDLDDDAVLVFAAARDDGVPCAEAREVALMDMAERGKRREAAE